MAPVTSEVSFAPLSGTKKNIFTFIIATGGQQAVEVVQAGAREVVGRQAPVVKVGRRWVRRQRVIDLGVGVAQQSTLPAIFVDLILGYIFTKGQLCGLSYLTKPKVT